MKLSGIQIKRIVSTDFEENAFVVALAGRNDCLVVDPGLEPEKIVEYLERNGLVPAAILNTHGHADHIAGNGPLKAQWPDAQVVIGSGDAAKLSDANLNLSAGFGMDILSPPADVLVDDEQTYSAAGVDLEVRAIPGHSIGHVIYLLKDHNPRLAFVGDVIFAGGIGRTDFPDGSFSDLAAGIHAKLFSLPDETILFPGHGPRTTVGQEKRTNPFVGERA